MIFFYFLFSMVKTKKNNFKTKIHRPSSKWTVSPEFWPLFSRRFCVSKKEKKIPFQFVTPVAQMLSCSQNRRMLCYSESLSKSRRGTNSATDGKGQISEKTKDKIRSKDKISWSEITWLSLCPVSIPPY